MDATDLPTGSENGNSSGRWVGFGIAIAQDEPLERGVRVYELLPNSSAAAAGIKRGDVIIGIKIRDEADLHNILNGNTKREVVLRILRGHQELWIEVRSEKWSKEREDLAFEHLMKRQEEDSGSLWRRLRAMLPLFA